MRMWVLLVLLCGWGPVVWGRSDGAKPKPPVRPNFVVIFTDDHAQQAMGCYGSRINETPQLDRIAREGMRFAQSFVGNSICAPSRATLLTGKHSHSNGQLSNRERFDGGQQTFPKLLQVAGYQTAIVGKWHLRADPTGFDFWEVLPGQGHYYNPDFRTPTGKKRESGYVTDLVTDKALAWLESGRPSDRPFLLMVNHKAPHRAWEPGPKHLTLYDDREIPEPPTLFDDYSTRSQARLQEMTIAHHLSLGYDLKMWRPQDSENPQWGWKSTYGRLDAAQRKAWDLAYQPKIEAFFRSPPEGEAFTRWKYQRYIKDYLRCIASVDDNVGRILDHLDRAGLRESTVVVYTSDQGFYLGEHGWYDKRWMYEESLRTPLLVSWPGRIAPGSTSSLMVQNIDLAPTFLELAGVAVPPDVHGKSLVPLLRGEAPADWRDAIYYHYYEGEDAVHKVHRHEGVRTKRYKLIRFYTIDAWELYDLVEDPHELRNIVSSEEHAELVKTLRARLEELARHYGVSR